MDALRFRSGRLCSHLFCPLGQTTGVTCYLAAQLPARMLGLSSPSLLTELLSNTLNLFYHDLLAYGNTKRFGKACRHLKHI